MKLLALFLVYATILSVGLWRRGVRSVSRRTKSASAEKPARLLIVGANGGTGRALVTQALERGYVVSAFVRNPSSLGIEHPRCHVMRGDVLDEASIDRAMAGQDAVLSALGHKRYFGPTRILSEGTRNLLRAMERHGVRRLVCETTIGIGDSAGRLGLYYTFFVIPIILPFYFWDKTRQERLLASSQADCVIVRPAALTNGEKRGEYRHGPRIGSVLWTKRISRADVADFMLNQLTDDTYLGAAPGVSY